MIETYEQIDSGIIVFSNLGFPDGSVVKNLPAMQQTWVRSLGQEDPLEKGTTIHSSIPAWRIPWIKEPGRLRSMALQKVRQNLGASILL